MRMLVFALLTANLGLLAWQAWIVTPPAGEPRIEHPRDDVPGLTLVSELDREPGTVAVDPRRCVTIGPFLDLPETAEAAARLRESGLEPSQRLATGEVWVRSWVFLPPRESREEARAVVRELTERGIRDILVLQNGEDRNAISLGVFSERERAERRVEQIRALNFEPSTRDRYREESVYWIDFELPNGTVIDTAQYQSNSNRPVELHDIPCGSPPVE